MEEEDIRHVELSTIAAIYPELQVDENDPHTVSIELSLNLANPLTVLFPAATEGAPPVPPENGQLPAAPVVDSHSLSYLPPLQVRIALPDGYPEKKPPKVVLSTSPQWLSEQILRKLEGEAEPLWEEMGRDQVIFTYIDNLQQSAENVFGLVDDKGHLEVGLEHKIAILDHDIKAKQTAFGKETFECGVCLDPKKGTVCHRLLDCGHVFCVECLQSFYNNAITEGDIASIQCLEPNCAKDREDAIKGSIRKKKAKTAISPSELLQIPLEHDMVMRYVMLKHKNEIESDKDTVYCPRSWCQGAARSKKHKKPEGLEFVEASDDESDEDGAGGDKAKTKTTDKELLAICEDCSFAFCTRCEQSWHGEFEFCLAKNTLERITLENMKSLEYLRMHTTPCPSCDAPCQKTQGCNHMCCFRCHTHFCYLCSSWLDPSNPYRHFNVESEDPDNTCYQKLWEGDGNDVEHADGGEPGGAGGPGNDQPGRHGQQDGGDELEDDSDDSDDDDDLDDDGRPLPAPAFRRRVLPGQPRPPRELVNGRVAVAREGPLVLRLEGNEPPPDPVEIPEGLLLHLQRLQQGIPNPNGEAHALNQDRGARRNRRGGGARVNRQNNRNRPQGQNQRANNNGRNGQDGMGDGEAPRGDGQLDARQEAWIRQFVQLALNDQEDLIDEWESDDE
ncbi:RWD-domain-containing protein [Hypoxylon crocopeplum]|nr:RWD-domain-containing protein [Hypoxylon crocopeplum]